MIVTGAEKVWPETVERVLERHPQVAEVAVVGRPDPEWGAMVVAIVVPSGHRVPDLESLRSLAKEHLPAACAPKAVEFADSLPRSSLGKVRRGELG